MSSLAAPPYLVWGMSSSMDLTYGIALLQGRRPALTDAVSAMLSFSRLSPPMELNYFAVYDGYRGPTIAEHLRNRLEFAIAEQIEHELVTDNKTTRFLLRSDDLVEWWRKTIRRAFWKVDDELVCQNAGAVGDGKALDVGATAVVALVLENYMVFANCGFSKAVVSRDGEAVVLTPEHEDDAADLQKWVETTGVCMADVKFEKAMRTGRAFGSSLKKEVEMAPPEVISVDRELGDEFLLLASNGVWGSITPAAACAFIRQRLFATPSEEEMEEDGAGPSATTLAKELAEHAIDKGSQGNVGVVLVLFASEAVGVSA